jgi:hypothetical protein
VFDAHGGILDAMNLMVCPNVGLSPEIRSFGSFRFL